MSTGPVVVVGEALVDLVPDAGGAFRPRLGGAPFNVARALCRLDQPARFVGRISTDRFGESLAAALAAEGVELHPSLRDRKPTALAIADLDAQGQAAYQFHFAGSAAEALEPSDALKAGGVDGVALYAGGLGLVLEPLATATEALLASQAGRVRIFLDPNVRPSATSDLAAYSRRLDRVLAISDVVKVSDADLQALAPGLDPETAARALLARGPKLILLTLGPDGAVALGEFGRVAVPAPRVAVVDTIGSGDAFSAAWLAEWLATGADIRDRLDVERVTAMAVHAAAFSCERSGSSSLTRNELRARFASASQGLRT